MPQGLLEVGTHVRGPLENEENPQFFRLGGAYTLERSTWATSANLNQFDLGYHREFKMLRAGTVLDLQKVKDIRGTEESLATFYFQLGAEILAPQLFTKKLIQKAIKFDKT
ncbi:MAG: hypothetical protein H7061_04625 [Bdellovibrionaceae bacterium]|nr:hypothetical protein [Bdellovibrio sp.]